ncbi:MAG: pyridoxamine 5'-phosphate oxidase family protein [Rothia sp. (in: high G+C Gram-positive bacteria)]|nr:pyridoxamine 5'-phosphate oxidase family protein [Rothia sp. (in: high G+C Gram-positive bacteria)]
MSMPMNIQGQSLPDEEPVVTVLTDLQIWELLAETRFARLGTIGEDGYAHIFPINVVSDGRRVFFRTAAGAKLLQLTLNSKVTLQVDRIEGGRAISINAFCAARQVAESNTIRYIESLKLSPWLDTQKLEFVELVPEKLTGRRFRLGK